MTNGPLFDWTPRRPRVSSAYPHEPSYKKPGTSELAAHQIKKRSGLVRECVLDAIRKAGTDGLTADEAAALIGESILTVRPRCTELKLFKLIRDSGMARRNESGKLAVVWVSV